MHTDVYRRLAETLDTLPNGFPATENQLEIKLLKKIFNPDEAELFCDLRLSFETPEQIAERTGRPLEGLAEQLTAMWKKGQVFGVDFGEVTVFKMIPWVFGIYEFQLDRMDQAFAQLSEAYMEHFGPQFFRGKPQLMQVLPVEQSLAGKQDTLPYQQVSAIINAGESFGLCVSTCPSESIFLAHRDAADYTPVPDNEKAWFEARGRERGVDFSQFQ